MRRLVFIILIALAFATVATARLGTARRIAAPTISTPSGGDPYFSNVKLLLHWDGADAATSTTDYSPVANTVTFFGNSQLDTAQQQFGSASLLGDGNGDYNSVPTLGIGANDFTIEFFVRFSTLGQDYFFGCRASAAARGLLMGLTSGNKLVFYAGDSNVSTWNINALTGTTTIVVDTWYYVSMTRSGSTWTMRLNGVQEATTTASFTVDDTAAFQIQTVDGAAANCMFGWIDEFRVTVGTARDTSSVPTSAFPNQ